MKIASAVPTLCLEQRDTLYASHGGVYRTVDGPQGVVVLGRGEGYAVKNNTRLDHLEVAIPKLREAALEKAKKH